MLFFLSGFSLILVGVCVYTMYYKWPSKEDDSSQILSFIYSIRLAITVLAVVIFVSVIGIETTLGEWFVFKVKNLGLNLLILSLYTFLLYSCLGVYILFLGYHFCVGLSFWRDFL